MQSSFRPSQSRSLSGGSLVPILIVLAALAASTAIFFLFTRKELLAKKGAAAQAQAEQSQASKPSPPNTPRSAPPLPAKPASPPTPPVQPPPTFGFARPADLGKQLLRSLAAGDFTTAGKLAAAADSTQSADATALFRKLSEMGFKPGAENQVELLGLVENRTRVSLPFTKPGIDAPLHIQLDLERDERMGWKVAKASLPKEMSAALTVTPSPSPSTTATATTPPPAPGTLAPKKKLFTVDEGSDALTYASEFVRHLLRHDFSAAQKFVDETKVPVERLIGLCIVFEEGNYALNPAKPLIVTIANPEVSWVIAQVRSETLQQDTEFGVELKRGDIAQPWKVAGLNLSEILGSFAQNASKLGVPYTPIVKNPKGGESLALYFEYDRAELHPRARKQIEVIAALMKADPAKKLRIAGHTDEKGEDTYNIHLSRQRAEAVKQQLVELGVPAAQVETSALGKAQPLSPNKKKDGSDNPEGRSHNRRAEIYLDF